ETIVSDQVTHGWNVLYQPLGFLLFLTGAFAECNRLPFDLPEAEQELVGGYHTEYSSMKFGLFFLGEYTHMITTSLMVSVLFLGGWHFPGLTETGGWGAWALKLAVLMLKLGLFITLYMVIRWTIPRFRFDQLMHLAWKVMIPLVTVNALLAATVQEFSLPRWFMLVLSVAMLIGWGLIELANANRRINLPVRRLAATRSGARV